jgi:hypothetical protein
MTDFPREVYADLEEAERPTIEQLREEATDAATWRGHTLAVMTADYPVSVAYHSDYLRPGRPAINVKVRPFHFDAAYSAAHDALAANPMVGEEGANFLGECAYEALAEEFWRDAAAYAEELGLGAIEQEGRSGGWLVIADTDPRDMDNNAQRSAWLARYRDLRAWCEEQIAGAPAATAALMLDMAADHGVTP